jgi:hypothetical protein
MKIVFCSDPLYPNRPDMSYDDEVKAAQEAGLEYVLIDFEKLTRDEDALSATRRVKAVETPGVAIYRGWMLRPHAYQQLYAALQERGVILINTPQAYQHCHYLPESYHIIAGQTPLTVWLPLPDCLDMQIVRQALAVFGDKPLVLKDYVKSRKHEWAKACYIPAASDRAAVESVIQKFIELQGEELNAGLVFREYVPLQNIGAHSRSGMPLTKEFRLFFLDGKLLYLSEYWPEGSYDGGTPPIEVFEGVAQQVQSRFFTMDVAQRTDGNWIIVELGDAQVAGLPGPNDAPHFYQKLNAQSLSVIS